MNKKEMLQNNGILTILSLIGILGATQHLMFLLLPIFIAIFSIPIARGQYNYLKCLKTSKLQKLFDNMDKEKWNNKKCIDTLEKYFDEQLQ